MPIAGMIPAVTCSMQTVDMDRSIKWYTEHLGFKLLYRLDDIGWCELGTHMPGVNVGLSVVERADVKGGATLTWGVKDIAAALDAGEQGREVRRRHHDAAGLGDARDVLRPRRQQDDVVPGPLAGLSGWPGFTASRGLPRTCAVP